MGWFSGIVKDYNADSVRVFNGRIYSCRNELLVHKMPRWLSRMVWAWKKPVEQTKFINEFLHVDIDYSKSKLTIDGVIFWDWLIENCVGEFSYVELLSYQVPHKGQPSFCDGFMRLYLMNPRDIMMFKLSFG